MYLYAPAVIKLKALIVYGYAKSTLNKSYVLKKLDIYFTHSGTFRLRSFGTSESGTVTERYVPQVPCYNCWLSWRITIGS